MHQLNLAALNSATKYPSIETYHTMGQKGRLTDEVTLFDPDEAVFWTEKVDGTNARIIQVGDDWFIGSREELLTARGDRVTNPNLGIVSALSDLAERLRNYHVMGGWIRVFYLEVYGHRVGPAAKEYTSQGTLGYRLFDIATVPYNITLLPVEQVAEWRDEGGQAFYNEDELTQSAAVLNVPIVPRLGRVTGKELPATLEDTHQWLTEVLPTSNVTLDENAGGRPEGIVIRNADRTLIRKARFQDYQRTLGGKR